MSKEARIRTIKGFIEISEEKLIDINKRLQLLIMSKANIEESLARDRKKLNMIIAGDK